MKKQTNGTVQELSETSTQASGNLQQTLTFEEPSAEKKKTSEWEFRQISQEEHNRFPRGRFQSL